MLRMKKALAPLLLALLLSSLFSGCAKEATVIKTTHGTLETYCEMSDGTWTCNGRTYRRRLAISGRMPNAAADCTFVYLSNVEDISFERAYRAAGVSSYSGDYFSPEEAVLVEWQTAIDD